MRYKSKKNGLTLVEVLVSLAILGIILIPFSSMLITATHFTSNSEQKVKAATLAQTIAEYVKNVDLNNINFNHISLVESNVDKSKYVRSGENPDLFSIYTLPDEYYKNIMVKIKYSSLLDIDTLKAKGLYLNVDNSNNLKVYLKGSLINIGVDNSIDKNKGPLDISINSNLGKLEVNANQGTKPYVNFNSSDTIEEINLNFETKDDIKTNITANNYNSSKIKLNCYKNSNTLAQYTILNGNNITLNNGSYYKNQVLINKGDTIGIEIYSTTNQSITLLQEIKVVKIK